MKKNFDTTALIKAAGWALVAIGGLMSSWAADKELKKETKEKLEEMCNTDTSKNDEED